MARSRNFKSSFVLVTVPAAFTPFTVEHELGTVPLGMTIARRFTASHLYNTSGGVSAGGGTGPTSFIGGWEFEIGGALGTDSGPNTLTLSNSGTTQVTGKVGNAINLVATSSQYLFRTSESLLQTGDIDYTVAAWLYRSDLTTSGFAVAKASATTANISEYWLGYGGSPTQRFWFAVYRPGDARVDLFDSVLGLPSINTWYFVVGWHDAAADTMNLQINNGTVQTQATGGALQAASTAEFNIGRRSGTTSNGYYNGRIDQVMFWKRVLSSDERTYLYNSGAGRTVTETLVPPTAPVPITPWDNKTAVLTGDTAGSQFLVMFFA